MQATYAIEARDIICGEGMPGHLAVPSTSGKAPAIILLHERYGLGRHTRGLADRFARAGFVCLAPNLFFKHPDQTALDRGDAHYDISDPEAAEYLGWALDTLATVPLVDVSKIAVQGTCQTGGHPFVIAAERPIGAVLIWYGGAAARQFVVRDLYPRPYEEMIAASHCPVLGSSASWTIGFRSTNCAIFAIASSATTKRSGSSSTPMLRTVSATRRCPDDIGGNRQRPASTRK